MRLARRFGTIAARLAIRIPAEFGIAPAARVFQHPAMPEAWVVLGLLALAVALFCSERVSVDQVTFGLLIVLVLGGILTAKEAFAGFGDEIIVMLGSIFVIGAALRETRLLDVAGDLLYRTLGRHGRRGLLPLTMGSVGITSAFMNNTTCTAMFLGPIIGLCRKLGVSPGKVLMPLSFASILGGTCTLIGTSTNLAVSRYLAREGLAQVGMFEPLPYGIAVLLLGIAYMTTVGQRWLPEGGEVSLAQQYGIREFLADVRILPGSPLHGQEAFDSDLTILDFQILLVDRDGLDIVPGPGFELQQGDIVTVRGKVENLAKVRKIEGIEIESHGPFRDEELQAGGVRLAEVVVTPRSAVRQRTIRGADLRRRHGLTVLALHRPRGAPRGKLAETRLQQGDVLLVQAPLETLEQLDARGDFALLADHARQDGTRKRGYLVLGVFLLSVVLSSVTPIPASVLLLGTALLAVLVRAIDLETAYRAVDWRLLVLIGGMMAFGTAMAKSGADAMLARLVVAALQPWGGMAVVAGMAVLTVLLTQPMSNAAAALVVLPVALQAAQQVGVSGHSMGMAVMLAASISVITPFEPSCILVYGPGRYRFTDFLKVGGGLTALMLLLLFAMLPWLWPLR